MLAPSAASADQSLDQKDRARGQHDAAVQVRQQTGPPHQRHRHEPADEGEAQVDQSVDLAQEREALLEEAAGFLFAVGTAGVVGEDLTRRNLRGLGVHLSP